MLPKIDRPRYETKLPSTNKKIFYYPFKVKHQEILLLAKESNDQEMIYNNFCKIIEECVENIKLDECTSYDIEWLILKIREKSIGEIIPIIFSCPECKKEEIKVDVKIPDAQIVYPEKNISNCIDLGRAEDGKNYKILLKHPSINLVTKIENNDKISDFKVIKESILYIQADDDNPIYLNETSDEEFKNWYDDLMIDVKLSIQNFILNVPKIQYKTKYKCKCGKEDELVLDGLADFFTF